MKRKNLQNSNGIEICDSIVMSVKKKRADLRKPAAVLIAIIGFTSVIMSFLRMFDFRFYDSVIFTSAVIISLFYIALSVIANRALWVYGASVIIFAASAYKKIEQISLGFKYVYNIIYSTSFHTDIKYYKLLDRALERDSVTTLFFFYIWLLAIVIYFFTICRPNPILPLLISFPVIEIGLYNGIEISVFWGVLTVAYWLALLAMSTIDIGEYSGGQSGFVRKNNLFFPKRHMKLKVTEKCGMFIIVVVMIVTCTTISVMKLTGYERSDELNQRRKDISEAMDSFSIDNFAESIANVSSAFGFNFKYENHKLGTADRIKYKNKTDLTVTIDGKIDGAVYLKNYSGSVYKNNEWSDLPASAYKSNIFDDFSKSGIYPQDFPCVFSKLIDPAASENTIWIKSQLKEDKSFAPYGTDNFGDLKYTNDTSVSVKSSSSKESSYKFIHIDANLIAGSLGDISRNVYSASAISDEYWRNAVLNYCSENGLITYNDFFPIDYEITADQQYLYDNGAALMAELLQNSYKDFVYDNYLQLPENDNMNEIADAYADIISEASNAQTASEKLQILYELREKMTSEAEYSLNPGKTPSNRDFVNYFLLENHKGYCIHYATSGVILARMAGIPARYATGYIIVADDFSAASMNPDGSYTIDVKDNRSHAWTEVYLDGYGWVPFEFTAGYSSSSINTDPTQPATTSSTAADTSSVTTASSTGTRTTGSRQSTRVATSTSANITSVTQAASQESDGGSVFRFGKGGVKKLPTAIRIIIQFISILLIFALLIVLRRWMILKLRSKRFSSGKLSRRIEHIYAYTERLLAVLKLNNTESQFVDFARQVEERIGGDYFESGGFRDMTDTALRSSFGNIEPSNAEISSSRKTAEALAGKLYERSGFFIKLRLKYIDVLV